MKLNKIYHALIAAVWIVVAAGVIYLTPASLALESDALGYYEDAQSAVASQTVFTQWLKPSTYFGDYGYTFILALIMLITGSSAVITLQLSNYFFWALASYLVARTLKHFSAPSWTQYLMFFSPVFLTFSSKLYSESYAALGLSLLLFSYLTGSAKILYLLGGFILLSTKSSFLPLLIIPLVYGLVKQKYRLILVTLMIPLLTLSNFVGSANQSRSDLVLAIQTAKLSWSYDTIAACTLYYVSYPLGQATLSSYQGACHPNNPTPNMPMIERNPYGLGAVSAQTGDYSFTREVLSNPLKYLILMISNLGVIVWFEGIYPSILLQLPPLLWPPLYLICKVALSLYLWYRILSYGGALFRRLPMGSLLYLSPLIFFVLVYGNFHEEQRYFYPLIPYMYLSFGLSWIHPSTLIAKFDKVDTDPAKK